MKIAYGSKDQHASASQREMGAKSGTRVNEVFNLVGRVEKAPTMSLAAYVSYWRGDTTIEICECERLLYDWNRSGTVVFVDVTLVDQFIALLTQACDQARLLASEKAEAAARKRKKKDLTDVQ